MGRKTAQAVLANFHDEMIGAYPRQLRCVYNADGVVLLPLTPTKADERVYRSANTVEQFPVSSIREWR